MIFLWTHGDMTKQMLISIKYKGMFAIVQEICCQHVKGSGGNMCDRVLPAPNNFVANSKPMKKRICKGDCIKTYSFSWAHKWSGSEMYRSWYA